MGPAVEFKDIYNIICDAHLAEFHQTDLLVDELLATALVFAQLDNTEPTTAQILHHIVAIKQWRLFGALLKRFG